MDAAAAKVPTVLVRHAQPDPKSPVFCKGSKEWELHPAVADRPRDVLVDKHLPGSFTQTDLDAWLKGRGIDTVAIEGDRAVIIVTHDSRIFEFADTMARMDDGHIVSLERQKERIRLPHNPSLQAV